MDFNKSLIMKYKIPIILYLLYWGYSWFGLLYTPAFSDAFLSVAQYMWYSLVFAGSFLLIQRYSYDEKLGIFKNIGLISISVLMAFTIYSVVTGVSVNRILFQAGRFSISPFNDYNVFVYSLILGVALLFVKTNENTDSIFKQVKSFIFAIVFVAIIGILSGSRRAIIMYAPIALTMPLFLLIKRKRIGIRTCIKAAAILMLFFILMLFIGSNLDKILSPFGLEEGIISDINKRITRSLSFFKLNRSLLKERMDRWIASGNVLKKYSFQELIFGRGTRSFYSEAEFIRPGGGKDSPHNFMFSAMLEGGIIKLFIILLLNISMIPHLFKDLKNYGFGAANFYLIGYVLWLITVMMSGEEFFYSRQILLILFVYFSLYRENNQLKSSNKRGDKMKEPVIAVHILLNEFNPDYRVLKELIALGEAGYKVYLLCLSNTNKNSTEPLGNIQVIRIGSFFRTYFKHKIFNPLKYLEIIIKMIKTGKSINPAIIHAHDRAALPIGHFIKKSAKGKLIYDSHEFWEDSNHKKSHAKLFTTLFTKMEHFIAKRADGIITVSDGIAELLKNRIGVSQPTVVRNVPDAPKNNSVKALNLREKFNIKEDEVVFIYVGGILPNRGVDIILKAFSRINRNNAHLVFLGSESLPSWMDVNVTDINTSVHFIPKVHPYEVLEITSQADVGVHAISGTCKSHEHCLPNKLFEYIQAGIAVIVTALPDMKKVVESYNVGYVFEDKDVDSLKGHMEYLINNKSKITELKNNSRLASRDLVWDKEKERLLELYDSMR